MKYAHTKIKSYNVISEMIILPKDSWYCQLRKKRYSVNRKKLEGEKLPL